MNIEYYVCRQCGLEEPRRPLGENGDSYLERVLATRLVDIDLSESNQVSTAAESAAAREAVLRYVHSGKLFWLERVDVELLAIGTLSGTQPSTGRHIELYCTTPGFRTIKDVGDETVVHADGRQLTAAHDVDDRTYFVRLVRLDSNRILRFWVCTTSRGVRRKVEGLDLQVRLNAQVAKGFEGARNGG